MIQRKGRNSALKQRRGELVDSAEHFGVIGQRLGDSAEVVILELVEG